ASFNRDTSQRGSYPSSQRQYRSHGRPSGGATGRTGGSHRQAALQLKLSENENTGLTSTGISFVPSSAFCKSAGTFPYFPNQPSTPARSPRASNVSSCFMIPAIAPGIRA